MTDTTACPITGDDASIRDTTNDYVEYQCPTCGTFRVTKTALTLAGDNRTVLAEALVVAKGMVTLGETPMIDNVSG